MIKNYNLFLINEGITISNEDIVEIIKSLETEDNKNASLINKLVNHKDNKDVTVLMNIVKSNNEELIDYVLQFNPDIHAVTKYNENVLFFCKSVKIFNKFYDLGVNVKLIPTNNYGSTTMLYLSRKKIFNEQLYQRLISDGVDINYRDYNNNTVLSFLITNKKAVEFLIRNKINLNDDKSQKAYIYVLLSSYLDYPAKRKNAIEIFKLLFKNDMKIIDIQRFVDVIYNLNTSYFYDNDVTVQLKLIEDLVKYFNDDVIISIFKSIGNVYSNVRDRVNFAIMLLNSGNHEKFYEYLKKVYYRDDFYKYFADYIKEHPYLEDVTKYNL